MSDDNQTFIPRSFVELFNPTIGARPRVSRQLVATRYDLCEDMAQMLTEHARATLLELGIAEQDVLERVRRGLMVEDSVVADYEADWITRRLAELLNWAAKPRRIVP